MNKEDLLMVIRQSLEEDFRNPEQAFQRMVAEKLIDADGQPIERERKLIYSNRPSEE